MAYPFSTRLSNKKRGRVAAAAFSLLCLLQMASGWKDCSISPQDEWRRAPEPTLALKMRHEYERRYTCQTNEQASFLAAEYYFDSPCLEKKFYSPDVQSCLKGRRVIFLGDSLSNQQGDSLLGMLGWHPDWMPRGAPRNGKFAVDESGNMYFTMADCWHPGETDPIKCERCYDLYESDFTRPSVPEAAANERQQPSVEMRVSADGDGQGEEGEHSRRSRRRRRRRLGGGGEGEREEESETSVHMRMVSLPKYSNWFARALTNYNGTRPGDVFVVNFGAHYRDTPEEDENFRREVFPVLDEMAKFGEEEDVTMVWREISPSHFPAEDGSYDAFKEEGLGNTACCTGTPPKQLDRNLWVETYIQDNGLADRVKLLKIYDMSVPRGAAHRTCHLAPLSAMDEERTESDYCHSGQATDCRHWSETGVVEEWNALLLNHVCES